MCTKEIFLLTLGSSSLESFQRAQSYSLHTSCATCTSVTAYLSDLHTTERQLMKLTRSGMKAASKADLIAHQVSPELTQAS